MATQAQIDANRRNAKLSTGPRTDAGKLSIRQNALRHGCCSTMALMSDEPEGAFQVLQNILRDENQPVGANEEILVYMMAVQMHNFGRANLAIRDALEAAEMDEQSVPPLPLALRYQTSAERSFRQNLNLLRKLQKERRLEEIGFASQEPDEAPAEEAQQPETPPASAPKTPSPAHLPREILAAILAETPKTTGKEPFSPSTAPPKAA